MMEIWIIRGFLMRLALICIISGLEFSSTAQSIPPSVTSSEGTGTNTSAIFAGSVNPNGLSTLAWFEWTTQFGQTNVTLATDVGSGNANIPLLASITGLTPGVAYFYQVVATNVAGFSKSEEAIFQTPQHARTTPRSTPAFANRCRRGAVFFRRLERWVPQQHCPAAPPRAAALW